MMWGKIMDYSRLVTRLLRLSVLLLTTLLLNSCINLPPKPDAGEFQNAAIGDTIHLSAEKSWDINGSELSFYWSFDLKPENSDASLLRPDSMDAEFIADVEGEYLIKVEVSDGKYTTYDYVTIYINSDTTALNEHAPVSDSCITCHDNIEATGKTEYHIGSSNKCDACHSLQQWMPAIIVNHTEVIGSCESCHNGIMSIGKNVNHILTTAKCAACHDTSQWLPAIHVEHKETIGECLACHNGTTASGMSMEHIQIESGCSDCHNSNSWVIIDKKTDNPA